MHFRGNSIYNIISLLMNNNKMPPNNTIYVEIHVIINTTQSTERSIKKTIAQKIETVLLA